MKKIVIGTLIVIVFLGCGLLTYTVANSGLDFVNPSLNLGGPANPDDNENLGQTGNNSNMVGGSVLNPCAANPSLQIQPLVENGQMVENAYMGLDLNAEEVATGLRYVISVPENAYAQYFQAWDGTTWEAVGPTQVIATAWTAWCQNGGWIAEQGFPSGQHRMLNANSLPNPIGQWITKQ